jgi:hypothetical protein
MKTKSRAELTDAVARWFAERIPDGWFTAPAGVSIDSEEILVVGNLAKPKDADDAGCAERIADFREETREARIQIARKAEALYQRNVSWGAECGDVRRLFTTASVPVMTRLRMPERQLLDTLIEAGVARSRSEALAWCVRLVGAREVEWLSDLEEALGAVAQVRREGPTTV